MLRFTLRQIFELKEKFLCLNKLCNFLNVYSPDIIIIPYQNDIDINMCQVMLSYHM